jgi:hypothetical protein
VHAETPILEAITYFISHLQNLRACADLADKVAHGNVGDGLENLVGRLRVRVQHGLGLVPRLGAPAFDSIGHEGPGGARKANERHVAGKAVACERDGLEDVAQRRVDIDLGGVKQAGIHIRRRGKRLRKDGADTRLHLTFHAEGLVG